MTLLFVYRFYKLYDDDKILSIYYEQGGAGDICKHRWFAGLNWQTVLEKKYPVWWIGEICLSGSWA